MGKLTVTEFMTLDGVAQAPGGPDEDTESGFEHGGWQWPVADEESGEVIYNEAATMQALLLGRKTYDMFSEYWPNVPQEVPFTPLINGIPKYVASETLSEPLSWNASNLLKGDLATSIGQLKDQYDDIQVIGSLNLVQSLLKLGLVDVLNLWVYPLVLGTGKKVFGDGAVPATLKLTQSTIYPGGSLHLTYEPAGPVKYSATGEEVREQLEAQG